MGKKLTQAEFEEKANAKHNNKYTYLRFVYTTSVEKSWVTCSDHGDFLQIAYDHTNGSGCQECAGVKKLTTEAFIKKANIKHDNKYTYLKTIVDGNKNKVIITCKKEGHGDFLQRVDNHLNGQGCPDCGKIDIYEKLVTTKEEFIEKANIVHDFKYTYDNMGDYINNKTNITITCSIEGHGDFSQRPDNHTSGQGCPDCGEIESKIALSACGRFNQKMTTEEFIEKANIKHDNKYTYLKTIVDGNKEKVIITCKKHKDFLQRVNDHLTGCGCPDCGFDSSYLKRVGMTQEEYNKTLSDYKKYYNEVMRITYAQPIHILENFDKKRGKAGVDGAWHLDHRYTISEGFKNKIPAEIIGNIANLELLPWLVNEQKQGNCSITLEDLFSLIQNNPTSSPELLLIVDIEKIRQEAILQEEIKQKEINEIAQV